MKEEAEPEAKSASAPARAAEVMPAAKPAAVKGKGSAIASMWSKAPAKKAKKAAPQKTAAQPSLKEKAAAVDAEAFMRLNQQVYPTSRCLPPERNAMHKLSEPPRNGADRQNTSRTGLVCVVLQICMISTLVLTQTGFRASLTRHVLQDAASSSGEEDEDDVPIRRSQAPRKDALADSDDEAEEAPAQKPAAPAAKPKAASKQPAKRKTVLDEASDSEDDWEAPKQAAGAHGGSASSYYRPDTMPSRMLTLCVPANVDASPLGVISWRNCNRHAS